jgi:hypothetical protein
VARAERFDLQSEYIEPDLERRVLAACAAEPEVFQTCADLLPADAFPAEQETWLALAAAAQTGVGAELLPWEPSAEPLEDARRLADLLARRHVAAVLEAGAGALHGEKPGAEVLAELEQLTATARQALEDLERLERAVRNRL